MANVRFVVPLPHPGEILREEFMAPLGLTAGALAKHMGLGDRTRVERLVRERGPVTPDTALRLARVFNVSPQFWMNLQAEYDLSRATIAAGDSLEGIAPISDAA